jgi:hypothetical protein
VSLLERPALESKDYEVRLIHRDIIATKVRNVSGRELFFATAAK